MIVIKIITYNYVYFGSIKVNQDYKMSQSLMSQTKFAELIGVSQARVSTLIKAGRLSHIGTKLKMPDAHNEYLTIKNVDPENSAPKNPDSVNSRYQKARADEKTHKAKLAEIELKIKTGELVYLDDTIQEIETASAVVRSKLLSLPNKLATDLQGLDHFEIETVLGDAINDCFIELTELSEKYREQQSHVKAKNKVKETIQEQLL